MKQFTVTGLQRPLTLFANHPDEAIKLYCKYQRYELHQEPQTGSNLKQLEQGAEAVWIHKDTIFRASLTNKTTQPSQAVEWPQQDETKNPTVDLEQTQQLLEALVKQKLRALLKQQQLLKEHKKLLMQEMALLKEESLWNQRQTMLEPNSPILTIMQWLSTTTQDQVDSNHSLEVSHPLDQTDQYNQNLTNIPKNKVLLQQALLDYNSDPLPSITKQLDTLEETLNSLHQKRQALLQANANQTQLEEIYTQISEVQNSYEFLLQLAEYAKTHKPPRQDQDPT